MLRERLVKITLEWEEKFGVAPRITGNISEYDAAMLVGMSEEKYSEYMKDVTAVQKGADFEFNGVKYQIKATRPSGKKNSTVTRVPKANNFDWDKLIWISYDKNYEILEAWEWDVADYKAKFANQKGTKVKEIKTGKCLLQK